MILYSIMQIQTIQDVINQLSQIEQQCTSSKNKAGYFAALYKRMTVAITENINANTSIKPGMLRGQTQLLIAI
jgi:uncharacterized protein DUF5995